MVQFTENPKTRHKRKYYNDKGREQQYRSAINIYAQNNITSEFKKQKQQEIHGRMDISTETIENLNSPLLTHD